MSRRITTATLQWRKFSLYFKRAAAHRLQPYLHKIVTPAIRRLYPELQEDVDALKGYTPMILSTIATQTAAEREIWRAIDELRGKLQELCDHPSTSPPGSPAQ